MRYCGTYTTERIAIDMPGDDVMHFIEMTKSGSEPTFWVSCCCDQDWGYEFVMEDNSTYERVKFNIMDAVFTCDTMEDLLCMLSEIFEDGFADILVDAGCDGNCEHCDNKYLN